MKRPQLKKLSTIVGKIEALEAEVERDEAGRLRTAKDELIRLLRDVDR